LLRFLTFSRFFLPFPPRDLERTRPPLRSTNFPFFSELFEPGVILPPVPTNRRLFPCSAHPPPLFFSKIRLAQPCCGVELRSVAPPSSLFSRRTRERRSFFSALRSPPQQGIAACPKDRGASFFGPPLFALFFSKCINDIHFSSDAQLSH